MREFKSSLQCDTCKKYPTATKAVQIENKPDSFQLCNRCYRDFNIELQCRNQNETMKNQPESFWTPKSWKPS